MYVSLKEGEIGLVLVNIEGRANGSYRLVQERPGAFAIDPYTNNVCLYKNQYHYYSEIRKCHLCNENVFYGNKCYKHAYNDKSQCSICYIYFDQLINNQCLNCSNFMIRSKAGRFVSDRKFGIELEINGPKHKFKEWATKSDGSLINGWEYISPPMSGYYKPIKSLREVCGGLKSTYIDKHCGFHLHVETADFDVENHVNCVKNAKDIESQIFQMVDKTRVNNSFCKKLDYVNYIGDAYSVNELLGTISDRYYWFNLKSLKKHKTTEIRVHHGVNTPEPVERWTDMWLGFFEYSKTKRNDNIFDIMREIGVRKSTRQYYEKMYYSEGICV